MVKLSVVVPVYNLGDMALECLRSLAVQEADFEFEVLVVDDASSDDSWEKILQVAATDGRFHVWRNPVNRGLAYNKQFLFGKAQGDYVAYMDGDDLALPGKLQALVDYLDQNPECSIVYHEAEVFEHTSGDFSHWYSRNHYNASYLPAKANVEHLIRYGCFLNASSVAFRRHESLPMVVDSGCKILLDYPMHILNACYLGGSIDRIDEVLGRYRQHSQSACGQNARSVERRLQVVRDQVRAVENARRFGVKESIIEAGKAHHYFAAALFFLKQGKDDLFCRLIESASYGGIFFDERQKTALTYRQQPDRVRELVFGTIAA